MAAGLLTMAVGNYWMSQLNLDISPWQVVWPRVVVIAGLSMLFAPLNVAAFLYIPKELRGAAVGLLALLRNEGGSVGTSVAQIDPGAPRAVSHAAAQREARSAESRRQRCARRRARSSSCSTPAIAAAVASDGAASSRQSCATSRPLSLAYFDVFWFSAVVAALLVFLVLLMRRSVAEKGAHIGAE